MKHRLILLAVSLAFMVSMMAGFFPRQALAAPDYFYASNQYDAIQGPNPYAQGDQPANATFEKVAQMGNGIYVAKNEPENDNAGGTCWPAIQTNSKDYSGDTNGKLYLECGYPDKSDPQGSKKNIAIGSAADNPFQQGQNGQQNGDNSGPPTCESNGSGFSLSWILCPIIEGMANAVDGIYNNIVQPLLETQPINLNDPGNDPTHTYQIWSNFRIYGDIFLVIALLVVVFGESIGGGLIDSYTAKKVLPRLLVAAILVNISIYIVALAVDLTNIIGNGIASLIQAPFHTAACSGQHSLANGSSCFALNINGSTGDLGVAALVGGGIWAAATFAELLEFLLVFFLIPAFLTFLAIMVTVLLRQGLIIFLILISPVAFALYCLPNTEQYFRKWWDLLFRTLMIYPIIAISFALANVLSVTIDSTTSGITKTFADFVSIIALFVPLFMIPFSFRIAGGVLGRFHEFATSARQRGQEAVKGNANDPNSWRNRVRRNLAAASAEHNVSGAGAVAQIPRLGDLRRPRSWNAQRRSRLAAARNMYQSMYGKQGQGYAMYEANSQDSNVTGDLAKYGSGEESRRAAYADADSARTDIERSFSSGSIDATQRAEQLRAVDSNLEQRLFSSAAADKIGRSPQMRRMALMNPATIGYEMDEGQAGWDQATSIMRDISGGDEGTYRSMVNEFQYVAKTAAGRPDLSRATDGKPQSLAQAWGTGQLYQMGSAKPRAIRSFGHEFLQQYQEASRQPMTEDVQQRITDAGRFYLEQETLAQNATGAVRDAAMANIKDFQAAGIEKALDVDAIHGGGTKPVRAPNPSTGKIETTTAKISLRDLSKEGMRGYDRDPNRLAEGASGGATPPPPTGPTK